MVDNNRYLLYKIKDGLSLYVLYAFRADFIKRMHFKYGHLRHLGLLGVINDRG